MKNKLTSRNFNWTNLKQEKVLKYLNTIFENYKNVIFTTYPKPVSVPFVIALKKWSDQIINVTLEQPEQRPSKQNNGMPKKTVVTLNIRNKFHSLHIIVSIADSIILSNKYLSSRVKISNIYTYTSLTDLQIFSL
jgi:hypothetical protein